MVGADAVELAELLPGLIEVEATASGQQRARVTDARKHELLLERVRRLSEDERWAGKVQVGMGGGGALRGLRGTQAVDSACVGRSG